ncbi:MAG TPA: DNA repair protein RecN, partial [Elusimicrobia bacterium]|nr:DNA repair protein RecN [Elusimicrobiota bacterium]
EELSLEFDKQLNILTGETGAGKTIILGALGLLLGERASGSVIRQGTKRCEINGVFSVKDKQTVSNFLKEQGLETNDESRKDSYLRDEIIIRREIGSESSRCFINSTPISLATLQVLGDLLVDIHGQHEHQALLRANIQRNLLDNYGNLENLRKKISDLYKKYTALKEEQEKLRLSEEERNQKIDLYSFQVQEIENAHLSPEEESELENEYLRLANAEKLSTFTNQILDLLTEEEGAALNRLQKVEKILTNLVRLDSSLETSLKNLSEQIYALDDFARQIQEYQNKIEYNPKKLEELVERREMILKLKKKYGATIKDILEHQKKIKNELSKLSHSEEKKDEIEKEITEVYAKFETLAKELSEKRKKVAEKLSKETEKELNQLGMPKAKFLVSLKEKTEIDASGKDEIEFLISPNPGEGVKPLSKIASGGEMSRIMLALKTILAQSDETPVLIFDEIDAGIGGPMGTVVGRKLAQLSQSHQVLCVTHLPQISVYANEHFNVAKETRQRRTFTQVKRLNKEEKIDEIARMLGGEKSTALKHAQELIKLANK